MSLNLLAKSLKELALFGARATPDSSQSQAAAAAVFVRCEEGEEDKNRASCKIYGFLAVSVWLSSPTNPGWLSVAAGRQNGAENRDNAGG